MASREESYRIVLLRAFRTLSWIVLFALTIGHGVTDLSCVPSVYAEDSDAEDRDAEDSDTEVAPADEDNNKEEKENDTDRDDTEADTDNRVESEEEPPEIADAPPSNKKKKQDESVSETEQELAEDAINEEVSEKEEAADKKEDAEAAAEEAAGAEVEIDESGEEEEPAESAESPDKPPVVEEEKQPEKKTTEIQKRVIGATATIMEKQSELLFSARVDSGAKSCSLHIEDYKIEGAAEKMRDNIGKVITFHIKNGNNESHWLEAKIAGFVVVKTAAHRDRRYKVPLTLRYKDFEKSVLVTLNNREKMEFPLLLGRNFLMGDFVVDVEVENNDLPPR